MMAAVLTIVLFAAPSETVSRAHFVKAQKSFTQHDWRHALDEFTAASETAPSELPDLWFDIAQCHRNLGHQRQAAAAFTRYLALAPDAPDRDKVRALIVSLGGKLDDPPPPPPQPMLTPPAPAPSIDPAPAPAPEPPPVATNAALPLVPPADAPPPPKAHRHWKVWTGVAVGVAAVALGVGLGVGLGMQSNGSPTPAMVPSLGSAATFDTRSH
jgi:tetratricopeptide (TPR) repeat protein